MDRIVSKIAFLFNYGAASPVDVLSIGAITLYLVIYSLFFLHSFFQSYWLSKSL